MITIRSVSQVMLHILGEKHLHNSYFVVSITMVHHDHVLCSHSRSPARVTLGLPEDNCNIQFVSFGKTCDLSCFVHVIFTVTKFIIYHSQIMFDADQFACESFSAAVAIQFGESVMHL